MRKDLFHYHLPPELIAQEPLPDRTASRLLALLSTGNGHLLAREAEFMEGKTRS